MPDVLAAENLPFAIALALLAMLVAVQALGLSAIFGGADADPGAVAADPTGELGSSLGGGLVSLLGVGRIPLLVWLVCLLACFALLGLSLQGLVTALLGTPFQPLAATAMGLAAALPVNAALVRLLGTVWPHDETTAVPIEALLGKRGRIAVGTARRGHPARAIVHDSHGQQHNVMVEPHDDDICLADGSEIMLVRREGELFFALDGNGPIRLSD